MTTAAPAVVADADGLPLELLLLLLLLELLLLLDEVEFAAVDEYLAVPAEVED